MRSSSVARLIFVIRSLGPRRGAFFWTSSMSFWIAL
jgi:hypothetical protein